MFSLKSANSVTKIFVISLKWLKPSTSCIRDQDTTTASVWLMWETESLNWPQFLLQSFIQFPDFAEFLFNLGKLHCLPFRPLTLGSLIFRAEFEEGLSALESQKSACVHVSTIKIEVLIVVCQRNSGQAEVFPFSRLKFLIQWKAHISVGVVS